MIKKNIKNQKKNIQKDKDKNIEKRKSKEQKVKFKIIPEKNTAISSNCKLNQLKISKAFTEIKKNNNNNRNIKIHNSISSKEEIKNKLSPSKLRNNQVKQNLMTNNNASCTNRFLSSNYLILTNDIDFQTKDEEKKIKKNKKNYSNGEKVNFLNLNAYKKNVLKKTIIIDDDGNNNLNLNLQKGEQHDYKNILGINNNKKEKFINNNSESNSYNANTETNSLFLSSNRSYMENYDYNNNNNIDRKSKEDDIKQTILDKNEEERRLKEYNKIFNLLNSNIEQFKKMFNGTNNNNDNTNNNNNNKIKNINKTINNHNTNTNNRNSIMNNNNKFINKNKNKTIIIKNIKSPKNRNQDLSKRSNNSSHKINHNRHYNYYYNYKINLKKNLSDKNLSSNNNNNNKPKQKPKPKLILKSNKNLNTKNNINKKQNLFKIDITNDFIGNHNSSNNYKNNNNENQNNNNCSSFLESSIQDDFYQSLINQTFLQNGSHNSFEINSDDFSNVNIIENSNYNRIIFTDNNKYKKDNIINIDISKGYKNNKNETKKKNSGSPTLAPRNRVKENIIKKMKSTDKDKDNTCKIDSNNNNDNTNCLIY